MKIPNKYPRLSVNFPVGEQTENCDSSVGISKSLMACCTDFGISPTYLVIAFFFWEEYFFYFIVNSQSMSFLVMIDSYLTFCLEGGGVSITVQFEIRNALF